MKDQRWTLWEQCFGDTKEYMDYYWNWKMKKNQVLEEERDGRMVSMLHRNPYRICLNGQEQAADYIVGVATHPDYRHRGLMASLLKRSMNDMYREGRTFTYLMPAAKEIYLPFDFRYVYTQLRAGYTPEQAEELAGKLYDMKLLPWDTLTEAQKQELCDWSNHFLAERMNLFTLRDIEYYDDCRAERAAAGGELLAAVADDQIAGVLSYMLEDGTLSVTEVMTENAGLMPVFFDRMKDQWNKMDIMDARYAGLGCEPEEKPIIMARLVNPEAFIKNCRTEETGRLLIQLNDPLIEANNGCFEIHYSPEGCRMDRLGEAADNMEVMSIGDLTEWIFSRAVQNIYINEIV